MCNEVYTPRKASEAPMDRKTEWSLGLLPADVPQKRCIAHSTRGDTNMSWTKGWLCLEVSRLAEISSAPPPCLADL